MTTRDEIKAADSEFYEEIITDVRLTENGFEIGTATGWLGVSDGRGIVPKVGQTARFYGRGFGYTVRGMDIDGQEAYYKTPAEEEAERAEWLAERQREKEEAEVKSRADYAARLALDPLAFDWDKKGPSSEAAAALDRVTDEAEFPQTYSGQSWRYAFRLWKLTAQDPGALDSIGPYDDIPGNPEDDLGLSGFMVGWGRNAVRQMRGKAPGLNGAIVTVGGKQSPVPASGTAGSDMEMAIGGAK